MAEKRFVSEKIKKIAEDVIMNAEVIGDLKPLYTSGHLKIIFLESDKIKLSRGLQVFADCEKVADSKRWAIDADFIITVYSENAKYFDSNRMKVLLLHELMHIGIEITSEGELKKYLVPHDIQEFSYITRKYGALWQNNNQLEFDF